MVTIAAGDLFAIIGVALIVAFSLGVYWRKRD
jgi:hypothetical protein